MNLEKKTYFRLLYTWMKQPPHFHVLFTPITKDGRLSCKDLYGGSYKLHKLQNRYAQAMSKFSLLRGIDKKQSQAKHTTIKEFYALTNKIKSLSEQQFNRLVELFNCFTKENKKQSDIADLSAELDTKLEEIKLEEIKNRNLLEKIRNKRKP